MEPSSQSVSRNAQARGPRRRDPGSRKPRARNVRQPTLTVLSEPAGIFKSSTIATMSILILPPLRRGIRSCAQHNHPQSDGRIRQRGTPSLHSISFPRCARWEDRAGRIPCRPSSSQPNLTRRGSPRVLKTDAQSVVPSRKRGEPVAVQCASLSSFQRLLP